MNETIERYLNETLKPQLTAGGVSDAFVGRILGTVRAQMESLLYHWFDEEFRKAILILGMDEGLFYKPHSHNDIRNFVVVTIRNSDIESLHSDDFRRYGLADRLSEETIKQITSAAIEYFNKIDFNKISDEVDKPENDIYNEMAEKYPVATQVLMELAGTKKLLYEFEKIPVYHQPTLDELLVVDEKQNAANVTLGAIIEAFSDGYAFSIGTDVKAHLSTCVEDCLPFVIDSFKSLTRNVKKLMLILEFLFSRWTPLVTTNCLVSNGYIERRQKPLKAGHSHDEMMRNWRQTEGLGKYHKKCLEQAFKQNSKGR